MTEFIKISSDMVQFNIDNKENVQESFASLLLNPYVTWAKFVLTDDEPNGNKVRIPKEEFKNLIDSGIYMPIKMEMGKVGGHKASIPIGVITHLQKVKNRVEGLAALWNHERPEDVSLLEDMFKKDENLNISWEIGYGKSAKSEAYEGVKDLHDTVLKAATVVETPAYKGRTTILALAEMEKKNMDELKERIEKLEKSLGNVQEEKQELLEKLENSETTIEELQAQQEELEELRSFKAQIEEEKEREERLEKIKEQFDDAGLEKDDEYFEENSETLFSLSDESLDFLIQELVAFGKLVAESEEDDEGGEEHSEEAPPIFGEGDDEISVKDIADFLKSRKAREE